MFYWTAFRPDDNYSWSFPWPDGKQFACRNYFYDMFGSLIVLHGDSGLTHVFAHSYFNQIFNKAIFGKASFDYAEEPAKKRFPVFSLHTLNTPVYVHAGTHIGYSGDAGYSSGPHIHYELHRGREWVSWALRPRPEELYPEIWAEWKDRV